MNNTIFASLVILAPLMFGQVALAENSEQLVAHHSDQQLSRQALTKSDLLEATQGYLFVHTERAQPRRSALFAQILDTVAQSSTLAKVDETLTPSES